MSLIDTVPPLLSLDFEADVKAAQSSGDFKPALKRFVKTKFFVQIDRSHAVFAHEFTLLIRREGAGAGAQIDLAEDKIRLNLPSSSECLCMSGLDIVKQIPADVAIYVHLSGSVFKIPVNLVDYLKRSIAAAYKAAEANALAKKQQEENAEAVSLAARTQAESPSLPTQAPPPPVKQLRPEALIPVQEPNRAQTNLRKFDPDALRKALGEDDPFSIEKRPEEAASLPQTSQPKLAPKLEVELPKRVSRPLDFALIKPRAVDFNELNCVIHVPDLWRETRRGRSLRIEAPDASVKIEVSGVQRENVLLEQWMGMCLPVITQEMPFLRQSGVAYPINGSGWRDRIQAMATEFVGVFGGDVVESRYLVCCFRSQQSLLTISIRAPSEVFEEQRDLLKWLLSTVDIHQAPSEAAYSSRGGPISDYMHASTLFEPAMFGFSPSGRLGRMRYIAFSLIIMLLSGLLLGISSVFFPSGALHNALVLLAWLPSLRLLAMRLHDFNRSSVWAIVLAIPLCVGIAYDSAPITLISLIPITLLWFLALGWPGSAGENDYGMPNTPNPVWVNIVAGITLFLWIGAGLNRDKLRDSSVDSFASLRSTAGQSRMQEFSPPDHSFSVKFPGQPTVRAQTNDPEYPDMRVSPDYISATPTNHYYVSYVEFLRINAERTDILNLMRDQLVRDLHGSMLKDEIIRVDGYSGRSVKVLLPSAAIVNARIVMKGQRVFMVVIESKKGADDSEKVAEFLNSFHVY